MALQVGLFAIKINVKKINQVNQPLKEKTCVSGFSHPLACICVPGVSVAVAVWWPPTPAMQYDAGGA